MNRKLYAAYGSNCNNSQMAHRCPTAICKGNGKLNDYRITFQGMENTAHANVVPAQGREVDIVLWEISDADEASLDIYEGVSGGYYSKNCVSITTDNGEMEALIYIMNPKQPCNLPTGYYYNGIYFGYMEHGIDTAPLEAALQTSEKNKGRRIGYETKIYYAKN